MSVCTLESHCANLRKRFYLVRGVQRFMDIAAVIGIDTINVRRFAHGKRLGWENMIKLEMWIIAQEQATAGEGR